MRIAIAPGHSPRRRGAVAAYGVREYDWQSILAGQVATELAMLGHEVLFAHRPDLTTLEQSMGALIAKVNDWRPDLAVELHFDACPIDGEAQREKWSGPTGLYWPGSVGGEAAARRLATAVGRVTGRAARVRSQSVSHGGHPLHWLRDTACPAVILETHFGTHVEDHRRATQARDDGSLALAIARACGS